MKLPTNNLVANALPFISNSSISVKQKMAASAPLSSEIKQSHNVQLSPAEKIKIDKFISQLEQKKHDKEFFSCFFNTMIHLSKKEKANFIAGTLQTLKLKPDESTPSLHEQFNKALKRYMSISLMSAPLSAHLSRNIGQIKLEADDGDDDNIEDI